jgi:hypothetical protein
MAEESRIMSSESFWVGNLRRLQIVTVCRNTKLFFEKDIVEQWFPTFRDPYTGKIIFLSLVPVTNSFVANCPGNIFFLMTLFLKILDFMVISEILLVSLMFQVPVKRSSSGPRPAVIFSV